MAIGWTFKREIDDICAGLRCTVGRERKSFIPEREFGPAFRVDENAWTRDNTPHRERLRPIELMANANLIDDGECVTVVNADDLMIRYYGTGTAFSCGGLVTVRFERTRKERTEVSFRLVSRSLFRVCWECGGDGYSHLSTHPRFPCLGCSGARVITESVAAFVSPIASLLLNVDGVWPALPDLKEDDNRPLVTR